ncbi:hypothetical protein [Aphanizomenon sp. UHCC 0183]|uniref:arginine synthesis PII-interacting regulator PirA n=1 Tax=Aphanizomenon sp. UHCC 0183 TaxID=2590028 RepID=UPI00144707E3|nr:hypothetical protein [Aphanizomenon sp. UHCC 0183]MTJ28461.1 hypothetical protein [Aphanizomenon sp. UHCC 0183]
MNKDRIELAKENLTTHKENMRKTLEHRLQLAKAQNDENLSRQLEAEMREYSENPEPSGITIDSLGFLRIFKTILAPKRGK